MAFDSTQQALRAEMLLEFAEIEIDLCPTPKEITAACALSINFPAHYLSKVRQIIEEQEVEIRGIFIKQAIDTDNIDNMYAEL
ncbi:DUF3343 domain-containing protein [Paenibacillus turicensis]|nr:DUF3343 domain-containing protein [Paenibacillus turicensis]